MLAATHIIFGAGCSMIASRYFGLDTNDSILMVAAGTLGSLLPDIDHPSSTFGRRIRPLSDLISFVFGHRGITHSLIAVLIFASILANHAHIPVWGLGLVTGYLSHLIGDWLTPAGIPFLWPFRTKFRAPINIRTGGSLEKVIAVSTVCFGFFVLFIK